MANAGEDNQNVSTAAYEKIRWEKYVVSVTFEELNWDKYARKTSKNGIDAQ